VESASNLESGMPWWVFCGTGSRFHIVRFRESGSDRGGTTGSASVRIVRYAWRDKTPTRMLTPLKKNRGGLFGGESGDAHD